ncbi:MAG: hypothetical protein ACRC0V_09785 [Fusobacteriaceae bacterium]
MTYIYKVTRETKAVIFEVGLNYPLEVFEKNSNKYYSKFINENENDIYYHLTLDLKITNPKFDEVKTPKIRGKTREELILEDGQVFYLIEGEKIENGNIVIVTKPNDGKVYDWSKKNFVWDLNQEATNLQEYNMYIVSENAKLEITKLENIIASQTASQSVKDLATLEKQKLELKIIV